MLRQVNPTLLYASQTCQAFVLSAEGSKQLVVNNSEGVNVQQLQIVAFEVGLLQLWSHVRGRTQPHEQLRSGGWLIGTYDSQSKIANLQQLLIAIHKDISRLEISMHNAVLMEYLHAIENLAEEAERHRRIPRPCRFLQQVCQVPSLAQLHLDV